MSPCRFVAEVSSNHNRDRDRALRFVDVAAECGSWAVKFQQFKIERLFAPEALRRDPSLLRRKAWETPEAWNRDLAERARARGIRFASTPFDLDAVGLLEPWVDFFKVASYQVLWLDLLREVARTEKPVVLATGMATEEEVRAAVDALRGAGCADLTLLHCVSTYPTAPADANLAALGTLARSFGLPVGWSDHSVDPEVVCRAVRRWNATLVELHLDLEGRGFEFPMRHCWLPGPLKSLVHEAAIPRAEPAVHVADGDGRKAPRPSEEHERAWRTDPSDGLRPLLAERARLCAKASA
jgi:N-acetylneuraminate synthase